MMYGYPNFNSPFYKYRNLPPVPPPVFTRVEPTPITAPKPSKIHEGTKHFANSSTVLQEQKSKKNAKKETRSFFDIFNNANNSEVFEIFGIQLHFDDILLICMLLFLYSEGVKDEWLFISLILLLLS